jgi:S1-C subfamily serine protease
VVVPGAAAQHARVVERDGAFVIQDAGSPAGTFLAGERVHEGVLRDGDIVELGSGGPQLRFQHQGEAHARRPHARGSPCASRSAHCSCPPWASSRGPTASRAGSRRRWRACRPTVRTAEDERRAFQMRVEEERHRFRKERRALEEQLEEARRRGEAELQARLAEATSGQVQALKDELAATRGRLEALEDERAAAERIIKEYGAGVCLIQGSYSFYDASDRPLRYRVDSSGLAVRNADGTYELDVMGGGGVHTVLYFGTGFLVDRRGLVLTNRHVGEPWWKDGAAEMLVGEGFRPRLGSFRAFFPHESAPLPLAVERLSERADLALLRVDIGKRAIPVLPIDARRSAAVPGRPVVLVGYPTGLEAILAKADASVVRQILETAGTNAERVTEALSRKGLIRPSTTQGHIGDVTRTDIVFDAPTTEGGSGGPVFNKAGAVIAVEYAILQKFGGNAFGVPIRTRSSCCGRRRKRLPSERGPSHANRLAVTALAAAVLALVVPRRPPRRRPRTSSSWAATCGRGTRAIHRHRPGHRRRRIVYVGDDAGALAQRGPRTHTLDAERRDGGSRIRGRPHPPDGRRACRWTAWT